MMLAGPLEEDAQPKVGRVALPRDRRERVKDVSATSQIHVSGLVCILSFLFSHGSFMAPFVPLFWLNDACGVWKTCSCRKRTCIPHDLEPLYYTLTFWTPWGKGDSEIPEVPFKNTHAIYLEETLIWKDICTPMFIAALFTIAKTWEQPKCP